MATFGSTPGPASAQPSSRGRGVRVIGFVVVVNKFVYKLVVIVNAPSLVDKKGFLHNVNGLRSR
jgi:hypothetical protein